MPLGSCKRLLESLLSGLALSFNGVREAIGKDWHLIRPGRREVENGQKAEAGHPC